MSNKHMSIPEHLYIMLEVDHTQKRFKEEVTKRVQEIETLLAAYLKEHGQESVIREKLYHPINVAKMVARQRAQIYMKPLIEQLQKSVYVCKIQAPEYDITEALEYFTPLWNESSIMYEEVETDVKEWIKYMRILIIKTVETHKQHYKDTLKNEIMRVLSTRFSPEWLAIPNEDILRIIVKVLLQGKKTPTCDLEVYMDKEIIIHEVPTLLSDSQIEDIYYDIIWGESELYTALTIEKKSRLSGMCIEDDNILSANPEIVFVQDNKPVTKIEKHLNNPEECYAVIFETWMTDKV